MYKCGVCRSKYLREDTLDKIFRIDGEFVMVYGIPATVCDNCGELFFSEDDVEKVHVVLHNDKLRTAKQVSIKAYEFSGRETKISH